MYVQFLPIACVTKSIRRGVCEKQTNTHQHFTMVRLSVRRLGFWDYILWLFVSLKWLRWVFVFAYVVMFAYRPNFVFDLLRKLFFWAKLTCYMFVCYFKFFKNFTINNSFDLYRNTYTTFKQYIHIIINNIVTTFFTVSVNTTICNIF